MSLWDNIKDKAESTYEKVSELQQRATAMDNRELCRAICGMESMMGYSPELKQRLEYMSKSEKIELFNYCKDHHLKMAATLIARSIKES